MTQRTDQRLHRHSVPASECVAALQRCSVTHVVTVPDWVQLALHERLQLGVEGMSLLNTCNENQAVTTAAGLTLGGQRPILVMQNQGFYNCINTVRAVCIDARIPTLFMVGQFGREFDNLGQPAIASRRSMVRLMEPLLDTLGIPFFRLDRREDLSLIEQAQARAHHDGNAAVVLVSAPLDWS